MESPNDLVLFDAVDGVARLRTMAEQMGRERTAFREAYRNTHVLKAFAYFVFDHVARKGYDKVITHAQPKYARLWRIILGRQGRRSSSTPIIIVG